MALRRYERIPTRDDILNKIQERVEDAFLPVSEAAIVDGSLITGVSLASGTTSIVPHNLRRRLKGWIVVGKNAAQHVYDVQSSNEDPDKFLYLTAGGTVTVDLWVF